MDTASSALARSILAPAGDVAIAPRRDSFCHLQEHAGRENPAGSCRTTYGFIRKQWTTEPKRLRLKSIHQMPD
jgi:hypothetical protein